MFKLIISVRHLSSAETSTTAPIGPALVILNLGDAVARRGTANLCPRRNNFSLTCKHI